MVKHVIIWKLKDEYTPEQKENIKKDIKKSLEALNGKIPGMTEIKIHIEPLKSSSGELLLDSTFESEEALKGYAVHPDHVEIANTKVRPFVDVRLSLDYEI